MDSDVVGAVYFDVVALEAGEPCGWARLRAPLISVGDDFDILDREVVGFPALDAHTIGRMVDDYVAYCDVRLAESECDLIIWCCDDDLVLNY